MRRRSKYARRGLATIVTSAIMLTAIAVMGSGLVSWANSNLFGHERNLESSYSTNVNKINEYLAVENVWFSISGGNKFVNVTMNNPSTIGLNVTEIKLDANGIINDKTFTNQPVLPKNSLSINFTYTNAYPSKIPINIYITTARGSIFTTQVVSP